MSGLRRNSCGRIIAGLFDGSIGGKGYLKSGGGPQLDLRPVIRHVSAIRASCRISSLGSHFFARSERYSSVSPRVLPGQYWFTIKEPCEGVVSSQMLLLM